MLTYLIKTFSYLFHGFSTGFEIWYPVHVIVDVCGDFIVHEE